MTRTQRRVAVAVDGSATRDSILRLFDGDGDVSVGTVMRAKPGAAADIDDRHLDAIIVVCAIPDADIVAFVTETTELRPWMPTIVACHPDAGPVLRDILSVGADDVIPLTGTADTDESAHMQLCFALEKAIALRAGLNPDAATKPGEVVTILGPKGGTGKTLTACNLGVALSAAGRRVAIVDLDLQFGDVGLSLALDPERTIADLAAAGGTLDADRLNDYLAVHSSGLRVLLAPSRPDQAGSVGPEFVREVITELRNMADIVIVDTPPGFTPEVIAAIDTSTALCVVAGLDSLSLKNTRLALDTLGLMGYPEDALQLVLNRADSKVGVHPADVQALLGRWPDILVPSHRNIARSVNEGSPIVLADPSSEAARAFQALAAAYSPDPEPETSVAASSPRRRRRLGRPHLRRKRSDGHGTTTPLQAVKAV